MTSVTAGGTANWLGAQFEIRVGLEFCLHMLLGRLSGLDPAPVTSVQFQAPSTVDDVVVNFALGSRWLIQARSGHLRIEWQPSGRFGGALRQLHRAFREKAVDPAPMSQDRLELAIDHTAPASLGTFGNWLDKARHHSSFSSFQAASTSRQEQEYLHGLTQLLSTTGDALLGFLRKCHIRRFDPEDKWQTDWRTRIAAAASLANAESDRIIAVLAAHIAATAPNRGVFDEAAARLLLRKADVPWIPPDTLSGAALVPAQNLAQLRAALETSALQLPYLISRPGLDRLSDSPGGVLIIGKPGSGKTAALALLAANRAIPTLVVGPSFGVGDVVSLVRGAPRRPYQLAWDDIHLNPTLFAEVVEKLRATTPKLRVLCSCRLDMTPLISEKIASAAWARWDVESLALNDFTVAEASAFAKAVADFFAIPDNPSAVAALAHRICRGDGTPLFALTLGRVLAESGGTDLNARELPAEVVAAWSELYQRFDDRPYCRGVLQIMRFLSDMAVDASSEMVEMLSRQCLGASRAEFDAAIQQLSRDKWLAVSGGNFISHDVVLSAIPLRHSQRATFEEWLLAPERGTVLTITRLRAALATWYTRRCEGSQTTTDLYSSAVTAIAVGRLAADALREVGQLTECGVTLYNVAVAMAHFAAAPILTAEIQWQYGVSTLNLPTAIGRQIHVLHEAAKTIQEVIRIADQQAVDELGAAALNVAATIESRLAELTPDASARLVSLGRAKELAEAAVLKAERLGLPWLLIDALMNCANREPGIESMTNDTLAFESVSSAIRLLERALSLASSDGAPWQVARCGANLSNRYREIARLSVPEEKRAFLERALSLGEAAEGSYRLWGWKRDFVRTAANLADSLSDLAMLERDTDLRIARVRQSAGRALLAYRHGHSLGPTQDLVHASIAAAGAYLELATFAPTLLAWRFRFRGDRWASRALTAAREVADPLWLYRSLQLHARSTVTVLSDLPVTGRLETGRQAVTDADDALQIAVCLGDKGAAFAATVVAGVCVCVAADADGPERELLCRRAQQSLQDALTAAGQYGDARLLLSVYDCATVNLVKIAALSVYEHEDFFIEAGRYAQAAAQLRLQGVDTSNLSLTRDAYAAAVDAHLHLASLALHPALEVHLEHALEAGQALESLADQLGDRALMREALNALAVVAARFSDAAELAETQAVHLARSIKYSERAAAIAVAIGDEVLARQMRHNAAVARRKLTT